MALSGGNLFSLNQVYQSLLGTGFTPQQAANVAGVVGTEGGVGGGVYTGSFGYQGSETGGILNPNGAFGIAQWNGSRQTDLQNFANSVGGSPSDLNVQTAFLNTEMATSYPGVNPNSVSSIVTGYESPAAQYQAGEISGATTRAASINQNLGAASNPYADNFGDGSTSGSSASPLGAGGNGLGFNAPSQNYSFSGMGTTATQGGTTDESPGYMGAGTPDDSASAGNVGGGLMGGGNVGAGDASSSYASINPNASTSLPTLASGSTSTGSVVGGLWEYTGSTATTTGDQGISTATSNAAQTTAKQSQQDTKSLNQTSQQNTKAINATSTADTGSLTSTLTNIASAGIADVFNLFSRSFVVIVGLVFLAGAVFMASRSGQLKVA